MYINVFKTKAQNQNPEYFGTIITLHRIKKVFKKTKTSHILLVHIILISVTQKFKGFHHRNYS